MSEPAADHEARRLAAVRRYEILDTPADAPFDRIAAMAARLCGAPISMISLVDHDRIWFKSRHGLELTEVDREPGFCASAILYDHPWIIVDAWHDFRLRRNALATGNVGIRFYAGVPLRTSDGFNLGMLCVMDREPRPLSGQQIGHLTDLAAMVMEQMELRLSARRAISNWSRAAAEMDAAMRRAELMAKELEHRVMNGLQLVSTTLGLQSRVLGDSEAARQLADAARRVAAIARVHRHIYSRRDNGLIDCQEYLGLLCDDLSTLLLPAGHTVAFDGVEVRVPTSQIASIGLLASELVTNAAKHGKGQITVSFQRSTSGHYVLSVADEGTDLPSDFDPAAQSSLGMTVVRSLAQRLGGQLVLDKTAGLQGTRFTVLFSIDHAPVA